MKSKSPLKYHGGKSYLAPKITALMPPHKHYVEPYFGGGAVLFESGAVFPDRSEVVNDIDYNLMSFWWTLQDPKARGPFLERCRLTPFSRADFEVAREVLEGLPNQKTTPDIVKKHGVTEADRAYAYFIANRQSLAARGKDWAPLTKFRTRRSINEQASAWMGAVDLLHEMVDRMALVVVECDEATEVIKREDTAETLFYCDPPYLPETVSSPDVYAHTMTLEDHVKLLDTLTGLKKGGRVILSGYPSKLYAAKLKGWKCTRVKIDNKASGGAVKDVVTECLWTNY